MEYNGATGNLVFRLDDTPFAAEHVAVNGMDQMRICIDINFDDYASNADNGVYACERSVQQTVTVKGGHLRNGQLVTVYIGYNVTSVRIITDIGYSDIWTIAPKPIGIDEVATATPTKWKNFWVLIKNVPSGDEGTLAVKSLIVSSSTYYSQCIDHLQKIDFDSAQAINLPVGFNTVIKKI